MPDPISSGLLVSIASSITVSAAKKVSGSIFRKKDIEDIIRKLYLDEGIEEELELCNITEVDSKGLKYFLRTPAVAQIFAEFYAYSERNNQDIELDFIIILCSQNIIPKEKCENFGEILFNLIILAIEETLSKNIKDEGLRAHDYKEEARSKRIVDRQNESIQLQKEAVQLQKESIQLQKESIRLQKERFDKINESIQSPIETSQNRSLILDEDYFDEELNNVRKLIKEKQFEEAKNKILSIIRNLEQDTVQNREKLSIAHQFLGICYNRIDEEGGNSKEAESNLKLSINYDQENLKAKATLASFYINFGSRKENYRKSYELIKEVWEESKEKDPQYLEVLLWSISFYQSPEKAIEFFNSSKEAQEIAENNDIILNVLSQLCLQLKQIPEAFDYINKSLEINSKLPYHLFTKGELLITQAFNEDAKFSYFEIMPKFTKYDLIESAQECFCNGLKNCDGKNELILEQRIKKGIYFCLITLHKEKDEIEKIRSSIDLTLLREIDRKEIHFWDFVYEFNKRNFVIAYDKLVNLSDWKQFPHGTKLNLSKLFFLQGAPEEAKKILADLRSEQSFKEDLQYWYDISLIEALLGNKSRLLSSLYELKNIAKDTENERLVLSHNYNLINRYIDEENEFDRNIEALKEYDQKFPDEEVIRPIKALDDDNKPTEEILEIIKANAEHYKKNKKMFKEMCLPSYMLEKMFSKPYVQILNKTREPDFYINYYSIDPSFKSEMEENFQIAESFILDYSSLLNISKMNLLEELERIKKKIIITQSLFDKIQFDLIYYENKDLRNLWEYIRKSKNIQIIDNITEEDKYELIKKSIGIWASDSIDLALKTKGSVFLADDLNFLLLLKTEHKIKGCISYFLLDYLYQNNFIDGKIFSLSIGVLAERQYIFLPYNGNNLYQIVIDDEFKITPRSYHLITQFQLLNTSFFHYIDSFEYFIKMIFKSGALFVDKIQLLKLITEQFALKYLYYFSRGQLLKAEMIIINLRKIWLYAVMSSKIDDLSLIEEEIESSFDQKWSTNLKEEILNLVEIRRKELTEKFS